MKNIPKVVLVVFTLIAASLFRYAPRAQASAASMQGDEQVTVIVTLRDQANLVMAADADREARGRAAIQLLQETAARSQARLVAQLETDRAQGMVSRIVPFWVFNGFSLTATPAVIEKLAGDPDVLSITPDAIRLRLAAQSAGTEPNVAAINAPALWTMGRYGQGVSIATLDTGVDITHPELAASWRGGANGWFDPYGQHPNTPYDADGHGTWTMGVLVGGNASGSAIGVAPQASWIAARIFSDEGISTATAIHQAFQWLLDPDGNPNTADAPNVVNNSWTLENPGCYLAFELDLQALRAAGILPIFAAGNFGPNAATSMSPANNPGAFAVGAVSSNDVLYANSSRGPTTCGQATAIYPKLTAPGVNVKTSDRQGGYIQATGTSLAAPHVAGALALLLSAFPNLSLAQQEAALLNSAVDLGAGGPDNDFGYGRLDVLGAYQWLLVNGVTPQAGGPITVTIGDDSVADDQWCSLREAVLSANSDTAVGGCTAGSGGDTIVFDAALPRPLTIVLTRSGADEDAAQTGDLDLAGTLTIDGASSVSIDGGAIDRVFEVLPGAHVTLLGLTIRNGKTALANNGGGVKTQGELTLRNTVVTSNQGGGIRNEAGSLTLSAVDVISNTAGYGIYNTGQAYLTYSGGALSNNVEGGLYNNVSNATLTNLRIVGNQGSGVRNEGNTLSKVKISASSILSNTAASGGALYNQGTGATATIDTSRIAYNTATNAGGGIFNNGTMTLASSTVDQNQARAGGGIEHFGGMLTLTNSTVSSNQASDNGGGLYNQGDATATHVTFHLNSAAGDGGDIFNDEGQLTVTSSIVAGAPSGGNCFNSAGLIHSGGYNLESANTCKLATTGDITNTDPLLGVLQDNSGPTPTHALRLDSPAVDRIPKNTNGCGVQITVDQRGVTRPTGDGCDSGAYEATAGLGDLTPIYVIQGAGHTSPQLGQSVTTRGIVTALRSNGFYLQYATPDSDAATSEGVFVTLATSPTVAVGDDVLVAGKVTEVQPGGPLSNDLTVTTLTQAAVTTISTGNELPPAIVMGRGGRPLPSTVIEDDALATFDPATDGLDYFESLEAMRVQVNNAVVVGPTTGKGDTWVLADGGLDAGPRSERGGIYNLQSDANPERVHLSPALYPSGAQWPQVDAGSPFTAPVVGVIDYSGGAYALLVSDPVVVDSAKHVVPENTTLVGHPSRVTVASLNVANLGGNAADDAYALQATLIVQHLGSPDILVLEEVGDNTGAVDDGITAAGLTFSRLITAVQTAGGP
ncbi:MAG: S8 family serine peptidase, partial [Caldilineaceae bacterium]|nr:S8 family serine peptidase [Caldilineaceae bacterium]